MDAETVDIQVSTECAVDAMSHIAAIVAYPNDPLRREAFRNALARIAYVIGAFDDPAWAKTPHPIRPSVLIGSDRELNKYYREGMRRFLRRLVVIERIVRPHLMHLKTGKLPRLPTGHVPTVENSVVSVLPDLKMGLGNFATVKSTIWGEAKCVAHIALAVLDHLNVETYKKAEANRLLRFRERDKLYVRALVDIDYPALIFTTAEDYRDQISKIRQFRLRKEQMMQFDFTVV
jgi:hypothetical protein